ncbi:MAG: DUF86 domain-containing protein [Methanobacteriota archaeon]|nr:MAG: DUF86 domain-containing protein [Euryarchaeota archaeon]
MNRHILLRKLDEADPFLKRLEEICSVPQDEFLSSFDLQHLAERLIEIVAQIVIDIFLHIHASDRTPETYGECIQSLHNRGAIDKGTSLRLRKLVQMRNLIVHQYGKIDYFLVQNACCSINADFSKFRQQILSFID